MRSRANSRTDPVAIVQATYNAITRRGTSYQHAVKLWEMLREYEGDEHAMLSILDAWGSGLPLFSRLEDGHIVLAEGKVRGVFLVPGWPDPQPNQIVGAVLIPRGSAPEWILGTTLDQWEPE